MSSSFFSSKKKKSSDSNVLTFAVSGHENSMYHKIVNLTISEKINYYLKDVYAMERAL